VFAGFFRTFWQFWEPANRSRNTPFHHTESESNITSAGRVWGGGSSSNSPPGLSPVCVGVTQSARECPCECDGVMTAERQRHLKRITEKERNPSENMLHASESRQFHCACRMRFVPDSRPASSCPVSCSSASSSPSSASSSSPRRSEGNGFSDPISLLGPACDREALPHIACM